MRDLSQSVTSVITITQELAEFYNVITATGKDIPPVSVGPRPSTSHQPPLPKKFQCASYVAKRDTSREPAQLRAMTGKAEELNKRTSKGNREPY